MPEPHDDTGLTTSQLWMAAWVFGFGAATAWIFLALELGRPRPWDEVTGFALGAGVACTVLSACCAVVLSVKSAEVRLRSGERAPHV